MPGVLNEWEQGQYPDGMSPMPLNSRAQTKSALDLIRTAKMVLEAAPVFTPDLEDTLKFAVEKLDQIQRECTDEAAFFSQQDLEQSRQRLEDVIYDLRKEEPDFPEIIDILDDIYVDITAVLGADLNMRETGE
jgi:hypothetical protein